VTVAGHRVLPHTADCIIEAWGPDRPSCLTQALQGLVEEFADGSGAPCAETLPLGAGPGEAEDLLIRLLEDVIYVVDVFSVVPVRFHLAETEDGGVAGDMEVVPLDAARVTGPAPKAVSYHGLSMSCEEGEWRCHALIDV
jgi:SHS2 domain-containing protein